MSKIRATYVIIFLLATLAIFQFLLLLQYREKDLTLETPGLNPSSGAPQCQYSIARSSGYRFIKPLVDAKQECESPKYMPVKNRIAAQIDSLKYQGAITSVSVYLQDFQQNDWINYNDTETFNPGSLLKVPLLMTYLRMNEDQPGLLNRELVCDKHNYYAASPIFLSKSVKLGKSYTIRQLLEYTIYYSDNDAYAMLCENADMNVWKKTYKDLGMEFPGATYPITAKQYSVFMDVLFNASYLTIKDSEYASELLSQCDFKGGMRKSLPDSVLLIHKFGEASNMQTKEFHESGIVYVNNAPYLLTIMTKGKDLTKLPDVVRKLSKLVYENMVQMHHG